MSKKIWEDYEDGDEDYYDGEEYEDDEEPLSGNYDFLIPENLTKKDYLKNFYSEERGKILEDILGRSDKSKCEYLANEGYCRMIYEKKDEKTDFPFQPTLKNLIIYCTEPLRAQSCKRYPDNGTTFK